MAVMSKRSRAKGARDVTPRKLLERCGLSGLSPVPDFSRLTAPVRPFRYRDKGNKE